MKTLSARKKRWQRKLLNFLYEGRGSEPRIVSKDEYDRCLRDPDTAEKAFAKAWEIRNFEIELYWKRATYFWAFVASTFVGYFALAGADKYAKPDRYQHAEVYFVICLGFIVSLAWLLTNRGSKQWQRNWESHIDLLEDQFTGPLYKTVVQSRTFSVSKINELVSAAICLVWILMGAKFLLDANLLHVTFKPNWFVLISTAATLLLSIAMTFGYGRGRFGEQTVQMYGRSVEYSSPIPPSEEHEQTRAAELETARMARPRWRELWPHWTDEAEKAFWQEFRVHRGFSCRLPWKAPLIFRMK
jgi:hypothetical protein